MVLPPASRVVRVRSTYVSPVPLVRSPDTSGRGTPTSGLHHETTSTPACAQVVHTRRRGAPLRALPSLLLGMLPVCSPVGGVRDDERVTSTLGSRPPGVAGVVE